MIRTLCVVGAALAIGAGSAGVANASMASPLMAAGDSVACAQAKVAVQQARAELNAADKNDPVAVAKARQKLENKQQVRDEKCRGNDNRGGNHDGRDHDHDGDNRGGSWGHGGPRGGSHDWHGRWDGRFDHGRTLDFGGIVVDFGAYPSLAAFRASDLYRLGSVDFRGACDEALRVRSFELRHGAVAQVVIPAGLTLVRGHYLNLGALGVAGVVGDVDVCGYGDWAAFDRFADRRWGHDHWSHARGHWGHDAAGVWRSLRARASCAVNSSAIVVAPQSSTTIVNQAAPASAPNDDESSSSSNGSPDVNYSAPAPSGGQVSVVPSGSVDTGDGSTEI